MAAEQVSGTPAPAPAPAVGGVDEAIDRMAAAVGGDDGLEPSVSDLTEPAPPPTATEAPAPGVPAPTVPEFDANHEFSEEELATPEGIQSAAAKIRGGMQDFRKKMVELDGRFAKFKGKEARQKETMARHLEEHEQHNLATRQIFDLVKAVRTGNAEMRLRALGTLLDKDPLAAIEELNIGIATDGKGKPRTPEEMEAEVERRLEAKLDARLKAQADTYAQEQETARMLPKAEMILDTVTRETHPEIAYLMNIDAAGVTTELLQRAEREGKRPVDYPAFLEDIERQLRAKHAPGNGTGTQTPQTAPSTPAESLSPSLTSRGGSVRQKSEAELQAEAEALVPAAWVRMGKGE